MKSGKCGQKFNSKNLENLSRIRFVSSWELGDFLRKAGFVCVSVIQVEIVTRAYDVRVGEQLL